jgi:CrcB protein
MTAAAAGTGFCGALTTYSTFSCETLRLLEDGDRLYAGAYVGASLLAGFGAVGVGWTLGSLLA